MRRRKLWRTIILVLLLIFVLIQFIPIDRSAPEVNPGEDFLNSYEMPVEFMTLVRDACYDCHSNESEYPWYSYVAPVSFWIQNHIDHGRKHLNYSIWTEYEIDKRMHKLEEMMDMVEEKEMPLSSYVWGHPEARLTDEQRAKLVDWFDTLRH